MANITTLRGVSIDRNVYNINSGLHLHPHKDRPCPNLNGDIANELYLTVQDNLEALIRTNASSVDFSLRDWEGKTALIIMAKISAVNTDILNFLFNAVARCPIIKETLEINAKDADGRTALHYLCAYARGPQIEKLLELGAEVNVVDAYGLTALDYTAINERQLRYMLSSISIRGDRPENAISCNVDDPMISFGLDVRTCFNVGLRKILEEPSKTTVIQACLQRQASLDVQKILPGASRGFGQIANIRGSSDTSFWDDYCYLRNSGSYHKNFLADKLAKTAGFGALKSKITLASSLSSQICKATEVIDVAARIIQQNWRSDEWQQKLTKGKKPKELSFS